MMVEELRTVYAIFSCVMVSLSSVNVSFLFDVVSSFILMTQQFPLTRGGEGVLPYKGFIGTCRGIGYGF